jgi:GWxTD domain-containing protein
VIALFLSESSLYHPWVQRLGWTLLHFLWQGTAIAVAYAMLRGLLARSLSAPQRYVLACVALAAMATAPMLTFLLLPKDANAPIGSWTISASESKQLMPAVVAIWLVGVLAFSIRLFGAWRFTARLRTLSHPAPGEWQQRLGEIAVRVGTGRAARLLISSLVDVPTVVGWLRPVILTPVEFLTGMPAEQITALLAHELAHIRRLDYLGSILQSVVEAVLFYHPAVWWISEQVRAERELCCDDLAVAAGGDVLTYARALAALEAHRPSRLNPVLTANGGSLLNRIRRLILLSKGEPSHQRVDNLPGPACAWAMILLWIAGIGVATTHAAQAPTPPLPPPPVASLPSTAPLAAIPAVALATHVRKTLLYDPFLSPQLAQPVARWRAWLDEDVAYIVSGEERNAFAQLTTDDERAQFIERFWLRRDPTPDTVQNEFKEEHYRRIAYANEHFASRIPGWKTDRGRVYITLGPPDEIEASARPSPVENWRYRHVAGVGNDVSIAFTDPSGIGEFRMAADQLNADQLRNRAASPELLPMVVQVDYMRSAGSSTMANITVQFENHKSLVNLVGRITTLTRNPVATFEKQIAIDKDLHQSSAYQQSVPLAAGRYRVSMIATDPVGGKVGNFELVLDVPQFDEDKLSLSSLILADPIEKLPAKDVAVGSSFAIGDSKVRPRVGSSFTPEEKMGIYLQIYNFMAVGNAPKPSGSIEYEIDKAGSSEKILAFSEEVATIPNASPSQVTVEKLLSLRTLAPGTYTLRVVVTDRTANQTVQREGNFTVSSQ